MLRRRRIGHIIMLFSETMGTNPETNARDPEKASVQEQR